MYSRVGGGHLSAARALVGELEATGQCTATAVDIYVDCGRFPVTRFPAIYARLARSHPRLWSLIYHGSSASPKLKPSWVVGPFLRRGVRRRLQAERPDVVIGVLPAVNEVLVEACTQVGARLEVVLTDWHSVHQFWQSPGVSHYTAPTESARDDCIRFGAAPDAVDVVGIPVRREFADSHTLDRSRQLTAIGLDPARFTILAMVGAEGSPGALGNLAALARSDLDAQLVVVCGRGRALRERVEHLPARMPVRALGFVEGISGLMRAADLLVTKAGGLTLAEAFCCGAPVVIYDLLPGQEAGNLEYVVKRQAAVYAATPEDLVRITTTMAADLAQRQRLAACGARLARPMAARDIAANVLARCFRRGGL
ncbi:MAG: glycosyltransferase [Chloroflexi bacterium]|nr:glycosyltransferase [Chloroflexota bacterium]